MFSKSDISRLSDGLDEVGVFQVKAACELLNELNLAGVSSIRIKERQPLEALLQKFRKNGVGELTQKELLELWPLVNEIRTQRLVGKEVAEKEQEAMVARLENCLSAFEHTREGQFARSLLDAAESSRWTRSEFDRAHHYVLKHTP
jgi:hypothetical protein